MSWEKVKLGELYTVHNGLSKGSKSFGSGSPFLSFSTVFNNYFIPEELTDLVQTDDQEQESYSILYGDVFVTRTSETSDELGMSCVALKDYPKATFNGFTKRMRPIEKTRVLPEYIGYYMRMPSFRGEFQAFSTMTTRASLKNEDLLSLTISLPSMEQQISIAKNLRIYDALIKNNQRQIKLLEEAAQRLYKEWFIDLRFPGHENTRIIDGVPEGWIKCTAGDVVDFNPKTPLAKDRIKQSVPMSALSTNSMILNSNEFTTTESNAGAKFRNGDTLLARISPCLENGKIAFVSDIDSEEGAVGSTEFIVMRGKRINQYMVYLLARTAEFHKTAINSMTGSDGRQRAQVDKIIEFPYLLASQSILDKFALLVGPLFEQIQNKNKQNKWLSQARDRLLPKLMSGEIEV